MPCYLRRYCMVKCPKCGFEQLPDIYCANCGVNIELFRPAKKPLRSRLLGSGAFYIFLNAIFIIATFVFLIRHYQKPETPEPSNVLFDQSSTTENVGSKEPAENEPKVIGTAPPSLKLEREFVATQDFKNPPSLAP